MRDDYTTPPGSSTPLRLAQQPPNDDDPYQQTPNPLTDPTAEKALLGALLLAPNLAPQLAPELNPGDFYQPRHETIWTAIHAITDHPADPITLAAQLTKQGDLQKIGGAPYLHTLMDACPTPGNALNYATQVRNQSRRRHVDQLGTQFKTLANSANNIEDTLADALQTLDTTAARLGPTTTTTPPRVETIDELLAGDDEDTYDWIIPGLIEHQDRIIITAEEGAGKSTLLRQIGVTAAAGIHPFTGQKIDPIRVLHIDVENTRRQSKRQYRPLRIQAGTNLNPDNLRIEIQVAGLDLTTPTDREWLTTLCKTEQPDLLLIGPIYKLANGNPVEEQSAKPVATALDTIRDQTDCALILEAHVAKAPSGQKKRPHEPYGWSGWLRWPEIGLYLDKDGKITHWRGAREEREWPQKLERGGHWPWTAALTAPDEMWIQIQKARKDAGRSLSQRDLEQMTGLSKGTIHRLVGPGGKYAYGWPGFNNSRLMGDKK